MFKVVFFKMELFSELIHIVLLKNASHMSTERCFTMSSVDPDRRFSGLE